MSPLQSCNACRSISSTIKGSTLSFQCPVSPFAGILLNVVISHSSEHSVFIPKQILLHHLVNHRLPSPASPSFVKMSSPLTFDLLIRDHAPNNSIPTELCTLQTCSITQAQLTYDPSLAGNVFFAALFGLLLAIQIILGIYYRTWAYSIGMVGGLILELCGYIGRIQMHYNPFIQSPFFMYALSISLLPCLALTDHEGTSSP